MKNLRVNKEKLIGVLKKGVVLTSAVFTLASVSACTQELPEDWPSEFYYISQEYNDFEEFSKVINRDGQPVRVYKGENVALTINKDTFEVKEYIFLVNSWAGEIYDLKTGYLICDVTIFTHYDDFSVDNNDILLDNCYEVHLKDISDYIEGEELKDYYTLEEIQELEPKIVEAVKIINGRSRAKTKQ